MNQITTAKHILVFTLLLSSLCLTFGYSSQDLPSIVVHSRNPVFACQDQTIHVKVDDKINFVCPTADYQAYANYQDTYENFYFLDEDKEAYDNCNATGGWKFLNCNQKSRSHWLIVFRNIVFPDQLQFFPGHTYYFIGTGFRTRENINNTIGGSCNATEDGRYPLKLKVYVCTREEVLNNTCNVCLSEGCYYKGCLQTCSDWVTISKIGAKKMLVQRKQCNNTLTGASHEEYREIAVNCREWHTVSTNTSGNKCIYFEKRECFSAENNKYTDYQEFESFCQPHPPTGAPQTGENDDSCVYKYVAIGTSIFFFIVGLFFGGMCHQQHHRNKISKKVPAYSNGMGTVNGAYSRNSGYDQFDGNLAMTKIQPSSEPEYSNVS